MHPAVRNATHWALFSVYRSSTDDNDGCVTGSFAPAPTMRCIDTLARASCAKAADTSAERLTMPVFEESSGVAPVPLAPWPDAAASLGSQAAFDGAAECEVQWSTMSALGTNVDGGAP